ncbi:single-stranded DNA-binding protein [Bifidobacterium xylocopae]|uniref:Single-stranded DNA-binding protein n=1 Tax=Bifidobacterium xylocopae TaxID=2493119 RepID=A0A366KDS3_9BIFI|nr:single-stranded DNA-binding protein [Bifidobacterium xylocopae]RBP99860.1 hypothetical protein CRD59_02170 [Bifidobacterium xylocopae]
MAMHQTKMTMTGFVGKDPVSIGREGATPVCTFRLGSSDGYYDAKTRAWREFPTTWMTVKAFKALANNVLQSVHKGDPVLVTGSVSTEEWVKDGAKRSSLVLEAESIGHDLSMGVSGFRRVRAGSPTEGSAGPPSVQQASVGRDGAGWRQKAQDDDASVSTGSDGPAMDPFSGHDPMALTGDSPDMRKTSGPAVDVF